MTSSYSTWVEISQSAYHHNIAQLKAIIGPRKLAVVVKANAYGHGMLEIASIATNNSLIDWFCVASTSEALRLKAAGVNKPILVMGNIDLDPKHLVGANIHLMVDTIDVVEHLNTIGKTHAYIFPIHIKVDTGLSRFGVMPDKIIQFISEIKQKKHVSLQGIYSHLSEADKPDKSFTSMQIERFKSVLEKLAIHNITIPIVHLGNSAATTTIDLPFCNLFRIGINSYGLWPSSTVQQETVDQYPDFSLKPVLTWKSRILSLKTFPRGNPIGYCRSFITQRDSMVAVITTGYYDGYDMRLSNNSTVFIGNNHAPVIGRIAMNTTFIDVTDIAHAQIGTEVILIGNKPGILPYDLGARMQNPNVREVLTAINPLIPRILTP